MKPRLTVLYDGACPLCRRAVDRLERWDREKVLEVVRLEDPTVASRFPGLTPDELRAALHVVASDGSVSRGADGIARVLEALPGKGPWGRLLRFPLVRSLARAGYGWVARNRARVACGRHCSPTKTLP